MRKKLLLTFALATATLIGHQTYVSSYASGPNPGYSGAPGDVGNCATSGCHFGTANTGSGSASIVVMDGTTPVSSYEAGKKYSMTVEVTDASAVKTGFQASVKNSVNQLVGTFGTAGNSKVKLSGNYINHSLAGINNSKKGSWTFEWTAPAAGTGVVTIYAAGNAANGDGTSSGDQIYTTSLTLLEDGNSGISSDALFSQNISLYPNPAAQMLGISIVMPQAGLLRADIYSLDGRLIKNVMAKNIAEGSQMLYADIAGIEKGIYFLRLETTGHISTQKFIKQ